MAIVHTEPVYHSDWLKKWIDHGQSFEEVTIKAGAGKLYTGSVLKKVTGKYEMATAGDDFAGFLYGDVDASGVDDVAAVVVNWGLEITTHYLTWDDSFTTQELKDALLAQLEAQRIKIRGDV
jgi:Bacteriophage lambda head decoration protein D